MQTVLMHATVVDVQHGTETPDRTIVLEGDRIVAISPEPRQPPSHGEDRVIDLRGKYVIPGLWDMHVHFSDATLGKLFVANGVTGVRVMWGNPHFAPGMDRLHFDMRDAFEKNTKIGPRMSIASQILDGPKPFWPGSIALATPEEGRKAVDDAKSSGVDFIKVYSRLPRDVYFAIAEESKSQKIPFEGHVPDSITVDEASDAGQRSIEHLTGMLTACSSREGELRKKQQDLAKTQPSLAERARFRREEALEAIASYDPVRANTLFTKLIQNDTWQCPTLTVIHVMSSLDDTAPFAADPRMQYVPDYMKRMWDPKTDLRAKAWTSEDYAALRAQFEKQQAIVSDMSKAGVPLLAGTDESNPYCYAGFSLHDELGYLVKAGLTPAEALRAATSAPARFLGAEAEAKMGSVTEGKVADLVILDADPLLDIANTRKIFAVVSRGTVHDRAALDQMLEDVKVAAAHPKRGR